MAGLFRSAIYGAAVSISAVTVAPASPTMRPFTVADHIDWASIENISGDYYNPSVAIVSPDSSLFVVRVTQGDSQRNVVRDKLLLFRSEEVIKFLRSGVGSISPPLPRVLVDIPVTRAGGQISHVTWIGNDSLGFIAESPDEATLQVFDVDVDTPTLRQVTHHESDVLSFALGNNICVYRAAVNSEPTGVRLGRDSWLGDMLANNGARNFIDRGAPPLLDLFISTADGTTRRIAAPTVRLYSYFDRIWLSPSSRYAVTFTPAINAPPRWEQYQVASYRFFGYTDERRSADPTSLDLGVRTRLQLVDLQALTAQPLIDAPSGFLALNKTPQAVFWTSDEMRIIVSNTYLPLTTTDPAERARRTRAPAIAEIDVRTGDARALVWEPVRDGASAPTTHITRVDWDAAAQELDVAKSIEHGRLVHEHLKKVGPGWRKSSIHARPDRLVLSVAESLSSPPRLVAYHASCNCQRVIYDPNPQSRGLTFGRVEQMSWKDSTGHSWKGGLVYPVNYTIGKKYPLVVQTHGFDPGEFLLGGPFHGTTAFAAQPLANAGFVVLQVEDQAAIENVADEAIRYADGYRSAIKQLVSIGIADGERVGMVAFSRTGVGAVEILAESPDLLTAAVLSDASLGGYMAYLSLINASPEDAAQRREVFGAPSSPDGDGIAKWIQSGALYKLGKARTAIRIESLSANSAIGMWEAYALLRYSGRPVDFVYIPNGSHVLFNPAQRRASQGGTVDWFRFWLQDLENPAPEFAGQNARWRKLRRPDPPLMHEGERP